MGKKITIDDVRKWKEMRTRGYTLEAISHEFSTSPKTVSKYLKDQPRIPSQETSTAVEGNSNPHPVSDLEKDPDILEMRKELEVAKLRRQIREVQAPLELENKLMELAKYIAQHRNWFVELESWKKKTEERVIRIENTIAIDLENYKCECGAQGEVAIYVQCAKCANEFWWGCFDEN